MKFGFESVIAHHFFCYFLLKDSFLSRFFVCFWYVIGYVILSISWRHEKDQFFFVLLIVWSISRSRSIRSCGTATEPLHHLLTVDGTTPAIWAIFAFVSPVLSISCFNSSFIYIPHAMYSLSFSAMAENSKTTPLSQIGENTFPLRSGRNLLCL